MILCALDGLGLIRVEGDDAGVWLQGQATQDVLSLREGSGAYTLFVLPTGRVRADAYVSKKAGAFDLVVPLGLRDALADVLERYVVMEDVTITKPAVAVITLQDATTPPEGFDARPAARLGTDGFDVLVPLEARADTLVALERVFGPAISEAAFDALRTARGVPRFGVDFGEDTLPQEAGVKHAVSFVKGCYIGQEPVVMLEHRGKPPKRLCVVHGSGSPPSVPTPVRVDGNAIGTLTSVAPRGSEGFVGLALVRRALANPGGTLAIDSGEVTIDRLVDGTLRAPL